MNNRRRSLIPKPKSTTELSNSRNSSPLSTPSNSPKKSNSNIHTISPSRLPLPNKKRSTSSSLDNYLDTLQSHLSADINAERIALSTLLHQIDERLIQYNQLCKNLKTLQKNEIKLNNSIIEYEIGIPLKNSILLQETEKMSIEIAEIEEKIEFQKNNLIKQFNKKEEKIKETFQELVNDANNDDKETIAERESKLENLQLKKKDLLTKIEQAKNHMNDELSKYKTSLSKEIDENNEKLSIESDQLTDELNKLKSKHDSLQSTYTELKNKDETAESKINSIESDIINKKKQIDELKYKLLDMKNLINHLQTDVFNASKLYTDFQDNEYTSTKSEWIESKRLYENEKSKRIKIEIQIREMSGIPTIIILQNEQNRSLIKSKLNEFIKEDNYDWKLEFNTELEALLDGISFSLLICNELEISDISQSIIDHLQTTINKYDKFNAFTPTLQIVNSTKISELLTNITIPEDIEIIGIHIIMENTTFNTKRQSVLLISHIANPSQLSSLQHIYTSLPCLTVCENISDKWIDEMQLLASAKPVRFRQSYSLLN